MNELLELSLFLPHMHSLLYASSTHDWDRQPSPPSTLFWLLVLFDETPDQWLSFVSGILSRDLLRHVEWFVWFPDVVAGWTVLLQWVCYENVQGLEIEYEQLFQEDHLSINEVFNVTLQFLIQLLFLFLCFHKTIRPISLSLTSALCLPLVLSHIHPIVLYMCSLPFSLLLHTNSIPVMNV